MIDRLAVDTNAVVDYLRLDHEYPAQLDEAEEVLVPLTVIGELYYGASRSDRPEHHRSSIARVIKRWPPLIPDVETAKVYGKIRAEASRSASSLTASKVNDFWIAALCIQHQLPLLTNDGGFDYIRGLTVIHW
ncbi:MAG TPA: PIN domain-containing protein [Thermoanaerobaculia bacterium]|nr:PIN domain-containing protein [Thermoanaerobaculia bacterium]